MMDASKKLIEAQSTLNKNAMEMVMADMDNIKSMTPQTLTLVQNFMKFVDASNKYIEETTKMIEQLDDKLNKLLERTKGLN